MQIGAFAAPDMVSTLDATHSVLWSLTDMRLFCLQIHWAPGLPKTRSGKIMRRILRKIAANQIEELGDTSTLAEPSVVEQLIESREQ